MNIKESPLLDFEVLRIGVTFLLVKILNKFAPPPPQLTCKL